MVEVDRMYRTRVIVTTNDRSHRRVPYTAQQTWNRIKVELGNKKSSKSCILTKVYIAGHNSTFVNQKSCLSTWKFIAHFSFSNADHSNVYQLMCQKWSDVNNIKFLRNTVLTMFVRFSWNTTADIGLSCTIKLINWTCQTCRYSSL